MYTANETTKEGTNTCGKERQIKKYLRNEVKMCEISGVPRKFVGEGFNKFS